MTAMAALTHAAIKTLKRRPYEGMSTVAAAIAATPPPSVLAKYKVPRERPTLPERRSAYATNIGNVAPISAVGNATRAKVENSTAVGPKGPVCSPTQAKRGREPKPYAEMTA